MEPPRRQRSGSEATPTSSAEIPNWRDVIEGAWRVESKGARHRMALELCDASKHGVAVIRAVVDNVPGSTQTLPNPRRHRRPTGTLFFSPPNGLNIAQQLQQVSIGIDKYRVVVFLATQLRQL